MAQRGKDKQIPEDQRSRGLNHEHQEGQDNAQNHQRQTSTQQQPTSTPKPPRRG
jgi:hypothetical protein